MFADHSFCESPFASFIEIVVNGEIFYLSLDIERSIPFDLNISRELTFEAEVLMSLSADLDLIR